METINIYIQILLYIRFFFFFNLLYTIKEDLSQKKIKVAGCESKSMRVNDGNDEVNWSFKIHICRQKPEMTANAQSVHKNIWQLYECMY